DCWMGTQWLSTIANYYQQHQPQMIVAPVAFASDGSLLQRFQALDFMTMQGITRATVQRGIGIMANGANLAFTRKAYDAVGGYEGTTHIISGDDYLLQLKIKQQYPQGIHYLHHAAAIVHTLPQLSWAAFLQQRIRWASKMGKYPDPLTALILGIIYLFNFSFLFAAIALLWLPQYFGYWLSFILLKTLVELLFLAPVARFFGRSGSLLIFPLLQPLHIIYIIIAGFLSQISTFEWKNRNIKQN
ncbi:MAG: glycosyltransferase, partial [Chitinophagaceae bacterium]|nr:glycosyltransferase [Chitinophagaceae bacterium]